MLSTIDRILEGLCILIFSTLFTLITLQIFSRYFIDEPFVWAEEGARFLFIWLCLLGSALAYRKKAHVTIDLLLRYLPDKIRFLVELTTKGAVALFLGLLIYTGLALASRGVMLPALTIPGIHWGHIYVALPLSASIMLIYNLSEIYALLRGYKEEGVG